MGKYWNGLREIGWEGVDWMHVAQYRDQCQGNEWVMNLRVP